MNLMLRRVILLAVLLGTTNAVWGRDRELWINSNQIMGFLASERARVEITLSDGSLVKGRIEDVEDLTVKVRVRRDIVAVQYREIKILRILRAGSSALRTFGTYSGALVGFIAGVAIGEATQSDKAALAGLLVGPAAGAATGAWLGGKHRTGLTLHIKDN
jgi:hypothetical protein